MANHRILLVDWRDKDHINQVIADNGFPIELVSLPNCLEVSTWIKDYNPSDFLEKYWGEDIFRPMQETEQDFCAIYGPTAGRWFHAILRHNNYDIKIEKACVRSRTNWIKTDIGHDYDLLLYDNGKEILVSPYHLAAKGNWDKLPEMADIKRIVKESRKNDPRVSKDKSYYG